MSLFEAISHLPAAAGRVPCAVAVTLLVACSDSTVVEKPLDRVVIVDQDAREWDITQAVFRYDFDPDAFLFGLGAFAIRPILSPAVVAPGDSGYPAPTDTFAVVGTNLGGDARAYAVTDLLSAEVVDDSVGATPVAVVYSPLASTVKIFNRVLDGTALTLSASGWVYGWQSVLFDYETESLWYRLEGTSELTCINGPLFESTLSDVAAGILPWDAWVAMHPGTRFMLVPPPVMSGK